jgi:two-component system, OmpR family, phosphate regulon response regulator PhoB
MHDISSLPSRAPHRTLLLVIEEPAIRELLAASFRHAGFFPVLAASAAEGQRLAGEVRPDVVLIDLDTSATAGFAIEPLQVGRNPSVPLLSVRLTARPEAVCGAQGELCGGSLCIGKPYSPRELVGRVLRELGSLSARVQGRPSARKLLRAGPLEIDPDQRRVTLRLADGLTELELAPTEVKLLGCLMAHPDRVLSRDQLLAQVWGDDGTIDPRTVDQNIRRLRRCFEAAGAGELIRTVRGLGYRLAIAVAAPSR